MSFDQLAHAFAEGFFNKLGESLADWILESSSSSLKQICYVGSNLPSSWIKQNWDSDYYITAIGANKGNWAVVMSSNDKSWGGQCYSSMSSFPTLWIKQKWNEGYKITNIAGNQDEWVVVMMNKHKFSKQFFLNDTPYFPSASLKERYGKGEIITKIAGAGNIWAAATSTLSCGCSPSQYYSVESSFPKSFVKKKWDDDYYIVDVGGTDTQYCVVMQQPAIFTSQCYWLDTDFPDTWISNKLDEGYYITSLGSGRGHWIVVMSQF